MNAIGLSASSATLRRLVASLSYKPGWWFRLDATPEMPYGRLRILVTVMDSEEPDREIKIMHQSLSRR